MWDTLLEWAKAVGLGSLVGVFVGARLSRGAQDRQFARQQAAQRIDRARAAYQDAEVIVHQLMIMLVPVMGELAGPHAVTKLADVPRFNQNLLAAAVKLRSENATDVSRSFDNAWTTAQTVYNRVGETRDVIKRGDSSESEHFGWQLDKLKQLGFALDQARVYWTDWLARQESLQARKRRRDWLRWRNRTATVVIQARPDRPTKDER